MGKYSIELFTRLDAFRQDFDFNNIYCYQLLLLFINEIFVENEHSEELYISLQENLKITIEAILAFNDVKDERINEIDIQNFDINNTDHYIQLLNCINNYIDNHNNYFIQDKTILSYINIILNKIHINTNNGEDFIEPQDLICENLKDILPYNNIYDAVKDSDQFEDFDIADNNILNDLYEEVKITPNNNICICEEQEDFINFIEKVVKEEENKPSFNDDITFDNSKYFKEFIILNDVIPHECAICGLSEWEGIRLPLYLNYKDHDKENKSLNNLEFLCPNCNMIYGLNDNE